MDPIRILFIGQLAPFLTTRARHDAFVELGYRVEAINQLLPLERHRSRPLASLTFWTLLTPGVFDLNRKILESANRFRPDVVWIEKGTFVFPRTMRALRRQHPALLVYHNTDDWKAKTTLHRIHWRFLLRSLPLYDLHITSNLHNVLEFREAGLPHVLHMELAANPALRDPGPLSEEQRRVLGGPVGFIGHWEPVTERRLVHLLRNRIDLRIYGAGWQKAEAQREIGKACEYRLVEGDEYARAIVSFDVNLGIVSKWNRNHTASRSFQIPALGSFLLHERNELVTRYFKEGVEAEFFDSDAELLEKCRHYLAHPDERRRIAEAGQRRCIESGYFEPDRVRAILPELESLLAERRRVAAVDRGPAAGPAR